MKETILNLTFNSFNNVIYFPIILIFIFILIWRVKKIIKTTTILGFNYKQNILLNFSRNKTFLKFLLLNVGLFFLFFSLLSPAWDKKEENVSQEGRDIYIALDISRSMLAKDLKPNRLEWAKNKIKKLINLLDSDRVGLILFSGSASLFCPLTNDLSTFLMFLDQVDTELISPGATSIDQAIKIAIDRFKTDNNKKNKLLVIFTDGEDFSSDLASAKNEAAKQNLKIFSIGSGTVQGAQIPIFDAYSNEIGVQLDENGKKVISSLNEGILNALTKICGGYYIRGSEKNDNDIEEIVNKVHEFEKEKLEDKKILNFKEQYPYFIAISLLCFCLEWIL